MGLSRRPRPHVLLVLAGLAALPAGPLAADAAAKQVRYTASLVSTIDTERDTGPSPVALRWGTEATHTTIVASTTRPFTLTRSDLGGRTTFTGTARLRGRATATGSGSGGESYVDVHGSPHTCTWTSTTTGTATVRETLQLRGLSPVRPILDARRTGGGAKRTGAGVCDGTKGDPLTVPVDVFGTGKQYLRRADLRKAFGHAFTISDRAVWTNIPNQRTVQRWTLRFLPVREEVRRERWRIEITGRERQSWGSTAALGAGVWVAWTHRSDLVVEDGRIREATGKVLVTDVEAFSDPLGVFAVSVKKPKSAGSYRIRKATLRRGRVTLGLLDDRKGPSRSTYRVDYGVRLIPGTTALAALRADGRADPEASYRSLLARGTIDLYERSQVPADQRVTAPLRATTFPLQPGSFAETRQCRADVPLGDCFTARGGETVTVQPMG